MLSFPRCRGRSRWVRFLTCSWGSLSFDGMFPPACEEFNGLDDLAGLRLLMRLTILMMTMARVWLLEGKTYSQKENVDNKANRPVTRPTPYNFGAHARHTPTNYSTPSTIPPRYVQSQGTIIRSNGPTSIRTTRQKLTRTMQDTRKTKVPNLLASR
jgi:hypothetical protein